MAWGDWASAAAPAAQLGSSLGSDSGAGGWGSWAAPAQAGQPQHGGSNWLGSWTDPLGLVTGGKHLAGGIIGAVAKPVWNVGRAVWQGAEGNGQEALRDLGTAGQNVGDIAGGASMAAEGLLSTLALPFGGETKYGLTNLLRRDVFQPFNKYLAGQGEHGEGTYNAFITPEMGKTLAGPENKGAAAPDWWQSARSEGIGAASLDTSAQAAMIAAPVAGVSGALAGAADDAADAAMAAGAAEDVAAYAAKAERYAKITDVLEKTAHPIRTVGEGVAHLIGASTEKAFPPEVTTATGEVVTPSPEPQQAVSGEAGLLPDDMHPANASAEVMSSSADQGYALSPELQSALDAAVGSVKTKPFEEGPVPEGHVRLYNGGTGDRTMWTSDPERAAAYGAEGGVRHIDVPIEEADAMRAGQAARDAGHQPTSTDYYLTPGELERFATQEHEPTTTFEKTVRAEPVEPTIEPRKYDVSKGKVVTPEERATLDEQLRSDTAAARENVDPPLHVLDETGARIDTPVPEWARAIADQLPDSINRLIAKAGGHFITQVRYRNLARNLMQAMETTQRAAQNSEAMQAGVAAAHEILDRTLGRDTASARIGEELHARLNGQAMLGEWAKTHAGLDPSPELEARLVNAAREDYPGIDDATWAKLPPEEATQLQELLNQAVIGFRQEAAKTMETLLASRYGAKGLESALLNPNEVPMTSAQLRLYRRSVRDMTYAAKARERIPGELLKREADAAKAEAVGARAHGVVDALRARLGFTLQTAQDLYKGIPKGMENEGAAVIQLGLETLAREGGALLDIGTGTAMHPTEGIHVPLAQQFDVPLSTWATDGARALHEAIFQPKYTNGKVVDPQALFGGPDAKLSLNIAQGVDGPHVVGTLSMHTVGGAPMKPWQAYVIGGAHEAAAGLDYATGRSVPLPDSQIEQNLMMHYLGDALDGKSPMTRWADQRAGVIADPNMHIEPAQLNREMSANLWLDHMMDMRNKSWDRGDIFNTELAMGKGEPTLSYLAQTIMQDLTLPEHIDKAMVAADAEGVNRMLAWYYKANAFVEQAYRGKTIPFTGRDAAETFYDVLALSSVMASPTQNLGRALAGFANLDDFLQAHEAALDDARGVMEQVMGNKPADVVYVKNLGVQESDLVRNEGETLAAYRKRVARDSERVVPKGQGGTPVARRWLESPAARELSNQTSMTTGPKYRIIDALLGKLNLETATGEDIAGQPEWWTGNAQSISDAKLSPEAVLHHAQLRNMQGPEIDAYRGWAQEHEALLAAREVRDQPDYVQPITDKENVEAQASPTAGQLGDNREVSAQEYQNLAMDGRAYVEQRIANSTPNVLAGNDALRAQLFAAVSEEWGGATVDAHSGTAIPQSYHGDSYAVTARLKGMKPIDMPIGSNEATFNRLYDKAMRDYKTVLDSDGGHLGVFNNPTTGRIEIDPVYHTMNPHDTEAVGAYTHAVGGAYHFRSELGFWIPHVKDAEAFASKAEAARAVKVSTQKGQILAKTEGVRPAYEQALMEYHGSGALAKLRSFRDNLAFPHTSLAVTLDTIMAQLFGFDKTHWGLKGEYAKYADLIRTSADQWSQIAGRRVMPHEVQALLWVYAKRFIGEQDWGRLQAHLTNTHTVIDALEQATAAGKKINVLNFDPLGPWWKQELQFSRDQLAVRTERAPLRVKRTAGTLTPVEAARLDYLEQVPTRQASQVQVQGENGAIDYVNRDETSYDAKVLAHKEDQYVDYLTNTVVPMRKALAEGDFNKARSLIDEYVTARRKAIMGSTEGSEFGPAMLRDPKSVGAQSIARLQYAKHIPAPNPEALGTSELYSAFGERVRGVTLENPNKLGRIMMRLYSSADMSTLLHEDLHAFRLMAPGDEVAQLSETYPHIQDATMTPARRIDEERFVSDFMGFLANQDRFHPLAHLFTQVADVMREHYDPALQTETGRAVPNSIVDYWDSIFNADIQKPNVMADPLQAQYVPENRGVNPQQARYESAFDFTQRTRQYGEARGESEVLQQRVRDAEARAVQADKFARNMQGLVLEPTQSQIISRKLEDRAQRTTAKIAEQLLEANGNQVPRLWRPYMRALDAIREEAANDPSLAPLLDEIPENFGRALQFAAEQGFDPTFMPELTWDMAQKHLYGHLSLNKAAESGMRKVNKSVLSKAGVVDHSLESLGAGTVMAMKELLQGRLVQFTEEHYARQWTPGMPIPDGWKPWDSTRDAIVTGRNLDGKEIAVNANKIVPDAVYDTLRHMQKQPVDLPFRFLWKGGPIAVWKHLILTFSPTWYLKHFIGAVTLATLEGARLSDWRTAYRQWRTNTMPEVARGRSVYSAVDEIMGQRGSLIRRNKVTDLPDLVRSEGYKVAAHEVTQRMRAVVKTTDSLGRAAVYARTLRKGGSVELAASRAYEALGDFGRLGPIERSMVTSIIPFYAFQKAMFRILLKMPNDHPVATGILMQLGSMHQAYLKDQLGALPDAYLGAYDVGGHLTPLDKLNPLGDSWRIVTPEGLAASANPFVRLIVQDALHAPTYNGEAGMDANGNLVQKPNIGETILGTYTGAVPGLGKPLQPQLTTGLSQDQYDKLLKRILKAQHAKETVDAGGYLVTDAYKPKKAATSKGWGNWG